MERERDPSGTSQSSPEPGGLFYILVSTFVFLTGWAISKLHTPSQQSIDTTRTQDKTNDERDRSRDVSPSPVRVVIESFPPSRTPPDERQAEKEKKKRFKWYVFGVNVLTLIAVIVYAGLTAKIWREMQTHSGIQREALINSERPWIGVVPPIIVGTLNLSPPQTVISGVYRVRNFGKSPALKVNHDERVVTKPEDLEMEANNICASAQADTEGQVPAEWRDRMGRSPAPPLGATLFPNQDFVNPIGTKFLNKEFPEVKIIRFVGCVTYRDVFTTKTHWTRFCVSTTNEVGTVLNTQTLLSPCGQYNDTDESYAQDKKARK